MTAILKGKEQAFMKRAKPLAVFVLVALSAPSIYADPMLERQSMLEKERQEYLDRLEHQNDAATLGWHWYKDPEPEEESSVELPPVDSSSVPTDPTQDMVTIDVKWLRENLPVMLDDAMNNPGDMQKLKLYWLAQKMAVDMATKFQDGTRRMYTLNPELSEDNRRPESQFALATHNEEVKAGMKHAVQQVFNKAGLWFFYSSTCQYCIKEGPILNYLERLYDVNILAVSMDGQALPGSEFSDVVVDAGGEMAAKLAVDKTPSMFLVSNDGTRIHKISEGLMPLDELLETILYVAQAAGFITEAELQESRDVRQYLMTDPPPNTASADAKSSLISVSKNDLDKGPEALIKELESRLNYPSRFTMPVTPAQQGGNQ